MADVLKQRARELPAPDPDVRCAVAEHAEAAGGVEILLANCLAHGRRQFVEVAENFPEECRYVLETLGERVSAMMRWRGNRNCRRKSGCASIRSTAGR